MISVARLTFIILLSFMVLEPVTRAAIPPMRLHRAFAKGDIFSSDRNEKYPLFKWELRRSRAQGKDLFKSTWSSLDGSVYAVETTELAADGSLRRYGIDQLQTGESGSVDVFGDKAVFSWKEGGKVQTSEEKISDDFVAPSTLPFLIQKKWKELLNGEKVKMRLAVLPWKETVGFYLKKTRGESPLEAEFEFTPSSPILSLFAPNIGFTINKRTQRIVKFHGPSLAKAKVNGKWKDVDVEALYRYLQ